MSEPAGRVLVGVQGFSASSWAGVFYPPDLPANRQLAFYAQVFDTVELDVTFYTLPSVAAIRSWMDNTPEGFTFCAKMPRAITHDKRLKDVDDELRAVGGMLDLFENKMGAMVIQFPRAFTRREEPALRAFLPKLPAGRRFAVEFRHPSWNDPQVLELLERHGIAWCLNEWRDLPTVIATTAGWSYVRLVGFHSDAVGAGEVLRDRSERLAFWGQTLGELRQRLDTVYVYVNNHYAGYAPATVTALRQLLGQPTIDPRTLWPQPPLL